MPIQGHEGQARQRVAKSTCKDVQLGERVGTLSLMNVDQDDGIGGEKTRQLESEGVRDDSEIYREATEAKFPCCNAAE